MDGIMEHISREGPNVEFDGFVLEHKSYVGATPLAVATMRENEPLMQLLVQAGADPDSEYSFVAGLSKILWRGPCVTIPVMKGSIPKVQFLMELQADIHAHSNNGATMLWEAAFNGHTAMVEFMLNQGVDIEQRATFQDDKELRYTPLQVAVKFSQRDTVETLLRHSADSTVTDKNAVTPLIDAVYENSEKIVTLLVSSLCSTLEKNTSDMLHAQLLNAIGAVFDHANPTVILAFAQGLVSTRSIVELLPRAELLKFLNAPLKTPLMVLQACFTRQSLAYVDQGRRTILSGTYITRYGDLRVKLGAHHQRITELYHEKVDIPRSLLRSITNLAPQEPEIPSQPYMTASFWMCSIPHVDTDTDVLQALLKGELDNFGDWRVIAIVQLLWDQAKVAHRNTQVLHLLNINFWTALNFSLWGKEKFVEETSVILTKCLLSAVAFLWLMELMQMVAYFAGHARIAKHRRYLRSVGRLIDCSQIVLPGAVIPALHFWGEAPLRSLEFRVLLGVVVFMRWVMMIYTLRTNRIVGTAIMSILSSMMTCLPFVIVLFSFICGVWNLYLAFGILNPPDSLSVVWRMIVLGDIDLWEMDGLPSALSPARFDGTYYLIRVFMVMGTFFFGLSLMNVFIAILAEAYIQAEEKKWKRFYRQRALIANRNKLQMLGSETLCNILKRCLFCKGCCYLTENDWKSSLERTKSEVIREVKRTDFARNTRRQGAESSIRGDKQSFLWVALPEHTKV